MSKKSLFKEVSKVYKNSFKEKPIHSFIFIGISLILAFLFLSGYAKSYLYLHEYGHSAFAVGIALHNHISFDSPINLSYNWNEEGKPITTRADNLNMTKFERTLYSGGGGLFIIFLAFLIYLLVAPRIANLTSNKKGKEILKASLLFFVCSIMLSEILGSLYFGDTDGLALSPLVTNNKILSFLVYDIPFLLIPLTLANLLFVSFALSRHKTDKYLSKLCQEVSSSSKK
jgi:hypothetical protein